MKGNKGVTVTVQVEGYYEKGSIRLVQVPPDLHPGPVHVVISTEPPCEKSKRGLCYGKYSSMPGEGATEEDLALAEWKGEM